MPENKEFEEWSEKFEYNYLHSNIYDLYKKLMEVILSQLIELNDKTSIGLAYDCFLRSSKTIFEAGQKVERDKHRWIPITEKLPDSEHPSYGSHIEEFVNLKIQCDFENEIGVIPGVFKYYERKFEYDESLYPDAHILAWQPLPDV